MWNLATEWAWLLLVQDFPSFIGLSCQLWASHVGARPVGEAVLVVEAAGVSRSSAAPAPGGQLNTDGTPLRVSLVGFLLASSGYVRDSTPCALMMVSLLSAA